MVCPSCIYVFFIVSLNKAATMNTPNRGSGPPNPCMELENPLGSKHKVLNIFPVAGHSFAYKTLQTACDSLAAVCRSSCGDLKSKTVGTTNPWHRASACDSLAAASQSSCGDFHPMRIPERQAPVTELLLVTAW